MHLKNITILTAILFTSLLFGQNSNSELIKIENYVDDFNFPSKEILRKDINARIVTLTHQFEYKNKSDVDLVDLKHLVTIPIRNEDYQKSYLFVKQLMKETKKS